MQSCAEIASGYQGQKWLVFCDTPLQIYNAVLLRFDAFKECRSVDIAVFAQFANAEKYREELQKSAIFDHVFFIQNEPWIGDKKLVMKNTVKALLGKKVSKADVIEGLYYDGWAVPCVTPVNCDILNRLRRSNPDIKTVFFEEGTASYIGATFRAFGYMGPVPKGVEKPHVLTTLLRTMLAPFSANRGKYNPVSSYLKIPRLAAYCPTWDFREISNDIDISGVPDSLFPRVNSDAFGDSIVILDSVRNESSWFDEAVFDDAVLKIAKSSSRSCYFRKHPRSKWESSAYEECNDCSEGMWEVSCRENASDDSILIGLASTAQLSPYMEAGKYPYLIFLNKVCMESGTARSALCDEIVQLVLRMYGPNSDRVFVPATLEETLDIVRTIENRESALR